MGRRHEISRRLEALGDIAGIMAAMQALALMETRILRDVLSKQQRLLGSIEAAAADFLAWHPQFTGQTGSGTILWIVLGSEQGFCGDFNDMLLGWLRQHKPPPCNPIIIGQRLASRLAESGMEQNLLTLPGASVADEVPAILQGLSAQINQRLAGQTASGLSILYHDDSLGSLRERHLLPLGESPREQVAATPYAPELNLGPARFFSALTGHFLYAALNEAFYSSLMAENRQRLAHMDHALHKLDEDSARLRLVYNQRRQEEITEEIEMILLSAGHAGHTGSHQLITAAGSTQSGSGPHPHFWPWRSCGLPRDHPKAGPCHPR